MPKRKSRTITSAVRHVGMVWLAERLTKDPSMARLVLRTRKRKRGTLCEELQREMFTHFGWYTRDMTLLRRQLRDYEDETKEDPDWQELPPGYAALHILKLMLPPEPEKKKGRPGRKKKADKKAEKSE